MLWLRKTFRSDAKPAYDRPPDARVDASPWLSAMLDDLGERYRFGADLPDGMQLLCRTGKARYNPMRAYVVPASTTVLADYDVRVHGGRTLEDGKRLLDRLVGKQLQELGLSAGEESVEDWAGNSQMLTRRYRGVCADPKAAAAAIKFVCMQSRQVVDIELEG